MPVWDQLRTRAQDLNDQLKTRAGQFRNREFAEAAMATCALVATADGRIDQAERARTAALIGANDTLAVFPPDDLRASFQRWCDKLERDVEFGRIDALAAVGKLAGKPEQARTLVAVARAIGAADGDFDATERAVVAEVCRTLNLPASDAGL